MLSIETLHRQLASDTGRRHLGHYSQNDKGFSGGDSINGKKEKIKVKNIELERVEEGDNGNWHNVVKLK